ncbi:hypothetical protein RCH18_000325 [Flavobacterium sp. PL11]|jgi:hypothetical protein|uniref:hypothetical protein n=1 Tax=Flavobacterium sp. PL11 TaxID=3071717 RepID=UPI002E043156|nr:hypothetical protein [Flavobacterium sp. PL11]
MKNNLRKAILTLFLVVTSSIGFAQGPGGQNPNDNLTGDNDFSGTTPAAPVDDWILPFVLVSAAVGYYAIRKKYSNSTV